MLSMISRKDFLCLLLKRMYQNEIPGAKKKTCPKDAFMKENLLKEEVYQELLELLEL